MHIELFLTPLPLDRTSLEDSTLVVIDVLRSSTSICAALMSGARGVVPMDGPGEAGELRTKIGAEQAILAGERDGVKIDGFHLGNSPAEFTRETVEGKLVIMTTTNGTGIFGKAPKASTVLACSLVNVSSVAARLARDNRDVVIVCSGRDGAFSIEDTICGGMLIHQLQTSHRGSVTLNDAGSLALLLFRTNKEVLPQAIREGEHGRYLTSIGFAADIDLAARVDSMPVLPVYRDGRLVIDEH